MKHCVEVKAPIRVEERLILVWRLSALGYAVAREFVLGEILDRKFPAILALLHLCRAMNLQSLSRPSISHRGLDIFQFQDVIIWWW